jgi:beta-lactamase regulating signal transducer with metallopeptidase domain
MSVAMELWLAGAIGYVALVTIQTVRVSRRWSSERLSTDRSLLVPLEDCKSDAGVSAPIGLVVSDAVSSPAILGWMRPRILLPASLVASQSPEQLRAIVMHELAHFKWLDVPFNWLFTLARAIHWFNPFAHFGALAWMRFREEAADESAVRWLKDKSGQSYGRALVQLFGETRAEPAPTGALAIVESMRHLKRRIALINRFPDKSHRFILTVSVALLLGMAVFAKTTNAVNSGSDSEAVMSVQRYLEKIDRGEYRNAWLDLLPEVEARIDLGEFTAEAAKVRGPLGKCNQRQQSALLHEIDPRYPKSSFHGDFVSVEFRSSFENADYLAETVIVTKDQAGLWKVFAYSIHP